MFSSNTIREQHDLGFPVSDFQLGFPWDFPTIKVPFLSHRTNKHPKLGVFWEPAFHRSIPISFSALLNTHCHTWSTSPFLLNPQYTTSLTTKWEGKTSRHKDDLFYRALITGGWMLLLFLSSSVSLHVCSTPVYLSGWNHVITASELFKQMRHLRSSPFSSTPALAIIHQKTQFQVPA